MRTIAQFTKVAIYITSIWRKVFYSLWNLKQYLIENIEYLFTCFFLNLRLGNIFIIYKIYNYSLFIDGVIWVAGNELELFLSVRSFRTFPICQKFQNFSYLSEVLERFFIFYRSFGQNRSFSLIFSFSIEVNKLVLYPRSLTLTILGLS